MGVSRQCCGMLGKQDNCQVAVRMTQACQSGSLPAAWQLYHPKECAPTQIERPMEQGASKRYLLTDACYVVEMACRERVSDLGLPYVVGVPGQVAVWPPAREPLPP